MNEWSQIAPSLQVILPELILAIGAMLLLMYGVFRGDRATQSTAVLAVVLMIAAGVVVVTAGADAQAQAFNGSFVSDAFARFLKVLILAGSALTLAMGLEYLPKLAIARFEYPILIVLATLGMLIMVSANDLIVLYVGLEMQSLSLYVLAAFARDQQRSTEAGLKYFVLGALSSGMLLYGASLVYGFAGSTAFPDIAKVIETQGAGLGILVGIVFVLAGLAFKVSAVPFHMWTPDVYEGSPTSVTAFFAAAPKVAAMGLFLRTVFSAFAGAETQWMQIVVVLSLASMALGAFGAIGQTNIKRLMAYSSIGHVGFMLVGFAAANPAGVQGMLIYLAIYVAMTVGVFVCILTMQRQGNMVERIEDLSGLAQTSPALAAALLILLFSMIGIPPFAGFWAKFYVFLAAVEAKLYWLAVLGFIFSCIGAFYYLRIIKIIYMDPPGQALDRGPGSLNGGILALSAGFVSLFILWPAPLIEAAAAAAKSLVN